MPKDLGITVFTKPNCPQCKMTKRFLKEHDLTFTEKDGLAIANELKAKGHRSFPVVEVKTKHVDWDGFRPDELNKLL